MIATSEQLVDLLPAGDEVNRQALFRLRDSCPVNLPFDSLESLCLSGQVSKCVVMDGERPVYVIWYSIDRAKKTLIAGASNVSNELHFTDLMSRALDQLAREEGCEWVEFSTKKRGVVRLMERHGFTVDTVNCVRRVQ